MQLPFVYYPGAGHDFGVLTHFAQHHGTSTFVFTDYNPEAARPSAIVDALGAWKVTAQEKITPASFDASHWKDFWFDHPNAHDFNSPREAFGTRFTLTRGPEENITLYYLCTDGIGTLQLTINKMGIPDVVVLQDHGMGGNWDRFGGHSLLFETACANGDRPPFIFLAENTEIWPGYHSPSAEDFRGEFGSASNKRALCPLQ